MSRGKMRRLPGHKLVWLPGRLTGCECGWQPTARTYATSARQRSAHITDIRMTLPPVR